MFLKKSLHRLFEKRKGQKQSIKRCFETQIYGYKSILKLIAIFTMTVQISGVSNCTWLNIDRYWFSNAYQSVQKDFCGGIVYSVSWCIQCFQFHAINPTDYYSQCIKFQGYKFCTAGQKLDRTSASCPVPF